VPLGETRPCLASNRPPQVVHKWGLLFTLNGLDAGPVKSGRKTTSTNESIVLVSSCSSVAVCMTVHWNITEQAAGIIVPYLVAAEPGPCLETLPRRLFPDGYRGVEIPVGAGQVAVNVRGNLSYGSERCFLIALGCAALQVQKYCSQVDVPPETSTAAASASWTLRVNPVKTR